MAVALPKPSAPSPRQAASRAFAVALQAFAPLAALAAVAGPRLKVTNTRRQSARFDISDLRMRDGRAVPWVGDRSRLTRRHGGRLWPGAPNTSGGWARARPRRAISCPPGARGRPRRRRG